MYLHVQQRIGLPVFCHEDSNVGYTFPGDNYIPSTIPYKRNKSYNVRDYVSITCMIIYIQIVQVYVALQLRYYVVIITVCSFVYVNHVVVCCTFPINYIRA